MFFPIVLGPQSIPKKLLHSRLRGIAAIHWKFKPGVKHDAVVAQKYGDMQIVNRELIQVLSYVTPQYGWMQRDEDAMEIPRLYKTGQKLMEALVRGTNELGNFGSFKNGALPLPDNNDNEQYFSAACWVHNEHYYKPLNKYVEIEHYFPGCPTQ